MGLRVATNIPSITAQRSLVGNTRELEKSMAQIATGSRITKAADDAAGLSISETLKSEIRSYGQAQRNAQDGISLIQVTEGALGEISNMTTRFRELAIQAASDTVGDKERGFIQIEISQLTNEIQRIANSTKFGDKNLLNGQLETFDFQVGIGASEVDNIIFFDSSMTDARAETLGIGNFDFSSKQGAQDAIAKIDNAQTTVNGYRANLGAIQNRLVSTLENIGSAIENLSAAKSRMRDADIAESSASLTRSTILQQASTSLLAQTNAIPQQALKLIG